MFGQTNDNQQTSTTASAQNPSMLDHVATQDLQPTTPQDTTDAAPTAHAQPWGSTPQQHPITTDNPFAQTAPLPQSQNPDPVTQSASAFSQASTDNPQPQTSTTPATAAPSQPATAPVYTVTSDDNADSTTDPASSSSSVDMTKLATLKQEAMSHLEPLVDHIGGTPEETFKTTMMMIQANDNHSLIDKALDAAKKITDDKERAEALLDIINEINYFSQTSSQ